MIDILMTISLVCFLASLPALFLDRSLDIVTNLSATVYSYCYLVRYYADALTITVCIVAVAAFIYLVIKAIEWIDGDGRDCIVLMPGQTIVGGAEDE